MFRFVALALMFVVLFAAAPAFAGAGGDAIKSPPPPTSEGM